MKLGHPFKIATWPLDYPQRVISIGDAQYIVHKTYKHSGEGNIRKETPVLNHLAWDVQPLKTTRPTVLLEAQGLVLGSKIMPLELR